MNKMYNLKYKSVLDLLYDKSFNIECKEHLDISKDNLDDFINSKFDIKLGSSIYITTINNKIHIYKLDGSIKVLLIVFSNLDDVALTNIAKKNFTNKEDIDKLLIEVVFAIKYTLNLNKIKNTKNVKTINGKFYDKLKVKNSKVEVLAYNETLESNYSVISSKDKVEFIDNRPNKTIMTIPTKLYPLPNSNTIKVFTSENTEQLGDDSISVLLTNKVFKPGFCYTNADEIIDILKSNNISNKVEFYSGWLYSINNMIHHAWVVIDDKHIIDTSIAVEDKYYDKIINNFEKGEDVIVNREEIANETIELTNSAKPFKEKYCYGKVLRDNIYVGVKTNSTEARVSFNELLKREPNHPNYKNITPTGSNKTLDLIYKKI